ncbi:Predicted nucleic acid-binding protein, contains PIN domain [Arboricoccus pini]|uniref:Predicted nucleic acid-binding protein, contains PIN domain n=1 Tax=Arboricoccus pini TaxID=1963835 RepID=A0A212RY41_9PROT|nr:PIN domain-containing protein [Arboricoccus pini]SNB77709.1 Predicted nucleic acid-binding protein, contains PIN domain [Arboricoccus pini]
MRIALDTNVLAYAEGVNGVSRQAEALNLLERLPPHDLVLPVQVVGELMTVLVRKAGRTRPAARSAILSWQELCHLVPTSVQVIRRATDLVADHGFSTWDAVILAAAGEGGCRILLSEDMQDGFTAGGTTIVNPFAKQPHQLLTTLLRD